MAPEYFPMYTLVAGAQLAAAATSPFEPIYVVAYRPWTSISSCALEVSYIARVTIYHSAASGYLSLFLNHLVSKAL